MVDALCRVTQILQDTTELVLIVGGAWAIKRLKDRAIKALQLQIMSKAEGETSSLARLMEGGSAVLNWVIWAIAALTALSAYGIDPSPLLASLGASSLVIGLAAQSVLSNTISGIALYASSSFKVGDHIELLTTSGSKVLHGTVQAIGPAQVVFRDEDGALIYINNSEAAKLIVRNLSQSVALLPNQG